MSGALLLILSAGCTQLRSLDKQADAIVKVEAATSRLPGIYDLTGTTNLPEKSQIRVSAVRYLNPANQASKDLNPKPTYSILAYQETEVNQGKWRTQLNLWKPASDGRFQEAWQLDNPQLALSVDPDTNVVFLATLIIDDRSEELQRLDQQLRRQSKTLDNGVLLTSISNSQRYVLASQTVAIDLPTGSTNPPGVRPEDVNGGWGKRYLMPDESPSTVKLELPRDRRTDAPPSRDEFLQ